MIRAITTRTPNTEPPIAEDDYLGGGRRSDREAGSKIPVRSTRPDNMSIIFFRVRCCMVLLALFTFCTEDGGTTEPLDINDDDPNGEEVPVEPVYLAGEWELSRVVVSDSCSLEQAPTPTVRVTLYDQRNYYRISNLFTFEGRGTQGPDSFYIEFSDEVVESGCVATRELRGAGLLSDDSIEGILTSTITPEADSCGYLMNCSIIEEFVLTRVKECNCPERAQFGNPKNSPYILPYRAGSTYLCTRSYCTGPHGRQLHYDFDMQVGDIVIAARAGKVRTIFDDYPDDGYAYNYVYIEHADGSVAYYAHLKQNSVSVSLGDTVRQGQPFAKSSESGSPGFPHLHFGVYQNYPPQDYYDVPMNFRNAVGPLDECGGLVWGARYKATSW